MGAETPGGFNAGIHTSTALVFRRMAQGQPLPPKPEPKPEPAVDIPHIPNNPAPVPVPPSHGSPEVIVPPAQASFSILDAKVMEAILQVESGKRATGPDGRLLIRFEAHVFGIALGNDALWAKHFRTDTPRRWEGQMWRRNEFSQWLPIHTGNQADEWAALEFASTLHRDAALRATSMGVGQVLGDNYRRIGYTSSEAMFQAFGRGLPAQLVGVVNYILSDTALVAAVNARDWRTIAAKYNGPGNVDYAAPKYQAAYAALEAA
jgi:hypothetical protein